MGIRKTDGMERIPVSEWNKREARKCIRHHTIIQLSVIIIGIFVVSLILYILHDMRIINLFRW